MPKRKHAKKPAATRMDQRKGGRMQPLSNEQKDFVHKLHTGTITQAELDAAEPLYAWTAERDQRVRQYFDENPRTALKNIATALGFPFHVVKQRARELELLTSAKEPAPQNARGYTQREWDAAGYDPAQWADATGHIGTPDSPAIAALIERLRSHDEGAGLLVQIKAHPLAPPVKGSQNGPTAHQLAHALQYAKTSRWFAAADAIARELDPRVSETANTPETPETPPDAPRITVACPHGDTRLVITRTGNNGFAILDGPSEVSYGVGFHGLPICPTHQVEMITGEPIPIADAMRQFLDTNPQQAKLFDTTKPFNFEDAWLAMEGLEDDIDALSESLESKLRQVKQLRKQLATKQSQHREARLEFKARRLEKAAQIIAAELAQEARKEATQPLDSRAHVGDGDGAAQEATL